MEMSKANDAKITINTITYNFKVRMNNALMINNLKTRLSDIRPIIPNIRHIYEYSGVFGILPNIRPRIPIIHFYFF